jgi:predicted nuclease of predicted toxin-antitoxin system
MKLLLDEGMPLRAAALLRNAGIKADHVLELNMGGASDEAILVRARSDNVVVATLDADFHQILAATGEIGPSVIRVRIERLAAEQMMVLLLSVLSRIGDELSTGVAVSVMSNCLRLRKLPLHA